MKEKCNNLLKILSIIGLISLTICFVILAKTPPATGYEISIYNAYPSYFWWFIILATSCGICTMYYGECYKKTFYLGFSIVVLNYLIVLMLPVFRGYPLYGKDDVVTHLGYVQDIIFSGHLGSNNFYPSSHILVATISEISSLDHKYVINSIPSLFYVFYSVSIFLLARVTVKTFGQRSWITLFGIVPLTQLYNSQFFPSALSILIIPIILFIFIKRSIIKHPSQYSFLAIIFLLIMPFFHPLTTIFLISIFLILGISEQIYTHIKESKINMSKRILTTVLILFITFFTWISYFVVFCSAIKNIYSWLIGESSTKYIGYYQTVIEKADLTTYQIFELFFKTYGQYIFYLVLSLMAIVIVFKKLFFNRRSLDIWEIFYTLLCIFFGFFFVFRLFLGPQIFAYPTRDAMMMLQMFAILSGLVLYEWTTSAKKKKQYIFLTIILIMLICSSIISIFSVYPSPITKTINYQVTYADFAGGEWILKNRENTIDLTYLLNDFGHFFPYAFLGVDVATEIKMSSSPPHLGYDSANSINIVFPKNTYLFVTEFTKGIQEVWPEKARYNKSDFEKLKSDSAANLIYTNKGFTVYYVRGI